MLNINFYSVLPLFLCFILPVITAQMFLPVTGVTCSNKAIHLNAVNSYVITQRKQFIFSAELSFEKYNEE